MEATYTTTITLRVPVEIVAEIDEAGINIQEIISFTLAENGEPVTISPGIVDDDQIDRIADDAPSYEDLQELSRQEENDRAFHESTDAALS